jgi:hypothetical protein
MVIKPGSRIRINRNKIAIPFGKEGEVKSTLNMQLTVQWDTGETTKINAFYVEPVEKQ